MVFIVSCNLYTENEKQNKKKIRNLNKTILKEKAPTFLCTKVNIQYNNLCHNIENRKLKNVISRNPNRKEKDIVSVTRIRSRMQQDQ